MDKDDPTTPVDNPSADAPQGTTDTDPKSGTGEGTGDPANNPDPSKSADDVADGEKKPEDKTTPPEDTPASKFDADLDEWVEKRKLSKPESDEQREAYQELRNKQREFTKEQQAKSDKKAAEDLQKDVKAVKPDAKKDDDELDPLEKDVKELMRQNTEERNSRLQSEFINVNKVSSEEVKAMGSVLKEMVAGAETPEEKQAEFDYWTNPKRLGQWHKLAKASLVDGPADTKAAAEEAAQKERERIAKESKATNPGRGAKNPTSGEKTPEQQRSERFSHWD